MDWKNIICELIAAGLTQAQIAKGAGVSQPTIAGLVSGAQKGMRWESGNRLLELHAQICAQKPTPKEATHA